MIGILGKGGGWRGLYFFFFFIWYFWRSWVLGFCFGLKNCVKINTPPYFSNKIMLIKMINLATQYLTRENL